MKQTGSWRLASKRTCKKLSEFCQMVFPHSVFLCLYLENRQSMLFSATQTTKVEDLARVSLRPKPLYINVDATQKHSTVETLEQGYVVCDADKRFLLLFSFLRRYSKKKIIVFFSSCQSVKYHAELLNFIDIPVLDLHVIPRKINVKY